jgi:tetratricopeptide (TPR) repeat protein
MMNRENYFEILGITAEATEAQIERAFRNKVKEHPPRKDPEGFRLVNEAGKLRDPEFRSNYQDSIKAEAIRQYLERYEAEMAAKHYDMALEAIKTAVKYCPDLAMLYNLKGHCFSAMGNYREAVISYQKAYNLNNSAVYLYNIAYTYFKDSNYWKAIDFIQRCLQIEPQHRKAVILNSRILNGQGQPELAVAALEKVVAPEAELGTDDFELLLQLLVAHIHLENKAEIRHTLERIKLIVWEDETLKLQAITKLWDLCKLLAEREYYEATYQLLLLCRQTLADPLIAKMLEFYAVARYVDALVDDPQIVNPLKQFYVLEFCQLDRVKKQRIAKDVKRELDYYILKKPEALQGSLQRLQALYPDLYDHSREYLQQLGRNMERNQFWLQRILRGWF